MTKPGLDEAQFEKVDLGWWEILKVESFFEDLRRNLCSCISKGLGPAGTGPRGSE